jgi:transposase-like protein
MTTKKTYTKEFKCEAVKLLETTDKTGAEISRELGIKRNQLYKWREELNVKGDDAFQGPGRRSADQTDQVAQLKKENAQLKEELEILKKAAAYFAREMK